MRSGGAGGSMLRPRNGKALPPAPFPPPPRPAPRQEIGPAAGMDPGQPERRAFWHIYLDRSPGQEGWRPAPRSLWCGPNLRLKVPIGAAPRSRIALVKVIASSLRKGNIVDLDS